MKSPDDKIYLLHIKEAIKKINSYVKNLDFERFKKKLIVQDAVIRQFEIIGEAAKRLSEDFKNHNTGIPWKYIIGMRNRLTHNYFGVDINTVWETIVKDIPNLKKEIYKI
jgi:uncharacterized protein with HEPN domain